MTDQFIEFCNRLSESWISWMGISLLESTVILAIIAGIWHCLKKHSAPQLGYLLFLLIPLRLLIPLEIHVPGVSWNWQSAATTADLKVNPAAPPSQFISTRQHNRSDTAEAPIVSESRTIASRSEANRSQTSSRAAVRLTRSSWWMLAWGAGVLWLAGRFGLAQRRLAVLLRNAAETDLRAWSIDVADLCRRIGIRHVRVLESGEIASPSVAGLWRPVIVLPAGILDSLSVAQREWIVLHEMAHIRRCDLLVNSFQRLATIVYFPNPAVWLANRQIGRLCEYACDDLASSLSGASQIEASEAFLSVMKSASARRTTARLASTVALGMSRSHSQSECHQRIRRLLAAGDSTAAKLGKRSLAVLFMAALVALPHLRAMDPPAAKTSNLPAVAAQPNDGAAGDESPKTVNQQTPLEPAPYEFSVIVAEHVLLLDGKTTTTWEGIAKHIEAVPEPLYAYPHFYITRGAMAAGKYEPAKQKIWKLHKDYNLKGHSEGSLWPRTDFRYDSVKTEADLKPDPALRTDGTIVADGNPVSGAEVVLIAPVDESISYKTYHIALVAGRIRNRLDHVMTLSDDNGKYTLYPPKDTPYYILALHPDAGFALISDDQLKSETTIRLLKWGGIATTLEDPEHEQEADLRTNVEASAGRPEICINQYWSDLLRKENPQPFSFKHVPPIFNTTISRSFSSPEGGATSLPAGSVSVLPGETRKIDFGEVTQQQLEFLKAIRTPQEQTEPEE